MFELYDFGRSSAAYRVRIALAWKGIEHDTVPVDLVAGAQHEADFRTVSPQGLVPVYSDEQLILNQSLAIIEYLNERYPEPPLLPPDLIARARVRQIAQIIVSDIHPLNGFRVHGYLRDRLRAGPQQRREWFRHWLLEGLDALELYVAASRAQRYCVGNDVSIADICLVPQLDIARRNRIDVEDFPRLTDIEAACMEHDAFKLTHPAAAR